MRSIPRTIKVKADDSYSAGVQLGRILGPDFSTYIERYVEVRAQGKTVDPKASEVRSAAWIESLPSHFADRFKGLSDGSGIPFERVASWGYLEIELNQGCSSIVCRSADRVWIAHNNDTFVPESWGYTTVFEIAGRIPVMCFGLAGDIWTTSGINKSRLWLHVDSLPSNDGPGPEKLTLPTYGFTVEALETCETIQDVADLLNKIDRTEGMILIVVAGGGDEAAVFECSCSGWAKVTFSTDWLVRTNHALIEPHSERPGKRPLDTWSRYDRLRALLENRYAGGGDPSPTDLRTYMADDQVERRGEQFATAYSVVACPQSGRIDFTVGGVPAASCGNWSQIEWPW